MKGGMEIMYDVIVVGAGPAGSTVAKKCAEQGLKTLMLEKSRMPREKVCSGMIMGPVAHALIKQEFGELPDEVLTNPSNLSGYTFHVPGIGIDKIDNFTLLTWRRDLDYWMSQKAQINGAEIWQEARVVEVKHQNESFSVIIKRGKDHQEVKAKFVVGADGATSIVRKSLFPEFEMRYSQVIQEHYRGEIELDSNYFHWFYPLELSPTSFSVHHKDGLLIVDVGGRIGKTNQLMQVVKDILSKSYHFDVNQKPVWKGSCLVPIIYRELTSRSFKPAQGNALLVGDAAGFMIPVSGEGIGTGIKSALLAASSIKRAIASGEPAEVTYLSEINSILFLFSEISPWFRKITEAAKNNGYSLPQILRDAYLSTLRNF
jgi:geranylgeranyl reductase family protein